MAEYRRSSVAAPPGTRPWLRSFWLTLLIVNLGLVVAGAVYAQQRDIPGALAVPIVAAFLWQASVYLVPGFPGLRLWLEARLRPWRLGAAAVGASLIPYLLYSTATEVFAWGSLGILFGLCLLVCAPFILWPPRRPSLQLQDLIVLGALAYPLISGLGTLFRDIYVSPVPQMIPRLDILGKLMLVPLGALAFLALRQLPGTGFQWAVCRADLVVGSRNYLLFLPFGLLLALGTGFVQWGPKAVEDWTYPFGLFGTMLGMYVAVALPEELFFRGILQNLFQGSLGHPLPARFIASLLFGLAHLGARGFPNWRYAVVAAVAGWFYGRAYEQRRSVVASSVTHTLVNVTWRYLFV